MALRPLGEVIEGRSGRPAAVTAPLRPLNEVLGGSDWASQPVPSARRTLAQATYSVPQRALRDPEADPVRDAIGATRRTLDGARGALRFSGALPGGVDTSGLSGTLGGLSALSSLAVLGSKAPPEIKASQALSGVTQGYSYLAPALRELGINLPSLPSWIAPIVSGVAAGVGARNAGEGVIRGGAEGAKALIQTLYPATAVPFALTGPLLGNVLDAYIDILGFGPEPSHSERERAETGRLAGAAGNAIEEVMGARTPEELWATLERYKAGPNSTPILHEVPDQATLFANPAAYQANIQGGVTPENLASANADLSQAVRRQVALLRASQAGDPAARAQLDRQRAGYDDTLRAVRNLLATTGGRPDVPTTPALLDHVLGGRAGVSRAFDEITGLPVGEAPGIDDLVPRYDHGTLAAAIRAMAGTAPYSSEGAGGGYGTPPAMVLPRVPGAIARAQEALAARGARDLFAAADPEGHTQGADPETLAVARALYQGQLPDNLSIGGGE